MMIASTPRARHVTRMAAASFLIGAAAFPVSQADARLGGGSSMGSRGMRTFSTPAPTNVAPRVAPIERSQTAAPFNKGYSAGDYAAPGRGFFGGNLGRGLLGGFLGAGLFGMLFGHGMFGGLGGGMGLLGLLLQIGLIVLAFRFIANLFRGQTALGGRSGATQGIFRGGLGGNRQPEPSVQRGTPIAIEPADYQVFEQRLITSQAAYSDNNLSVLRGIATNEMAGNFARELAGNSRQGVSNRLSEVRLISGDLSEAWREGASDYATVAMRFSLVDVTIEQATGRVLSGSPGQPQQVTEAWTFVRPAGSGPQGWLLSAIQQA